MKKPIVNENSKERIANIELTSISGLYSINGYKPLEMQVKAHNSPTKFLLVGGGYGGGKSCFLANHALYHMLRFPNSRVLLARQYLSALKRSTLLTLLEWIPEELVKIHHKHDSKIELKNGSVLYYSGLRDDQSSLKKHLSTEYSLILIDEISEINEEAFRLLASRLRHKAVPQEHYQIVGSTNPTNNWVRSRWIENKLEDHDFVEFLAKRNSYLPSDYISGLRNILTPSQVESMINGSWDSVEDENNIYDFYEIEKAINRATTGGGEEIWSADIASIGGDSSVICKKTGNKISVVAEFKKKTLMETVGEIVKVIHFDKTKKIVIDAVGEGAGVASRLEEMGYEVIPFKGSSKSSFPEQFINKKTEMYFKLQEVLPELDLPKNPELRLQMLNSRYYLRSSGKLAAESREMLKRRNLNSPNHLDAIAMLFATDGMEDMTWQQEMYEYLKNKESKDESQMTNEEIMEEYARKHGVRAKEVKKR